jgi:hypothetical protein
LLYFLISEGWVFNRFSHCSGKEQRVLLR